MTPSVPPTEGIDGAEMDTLSSVAMSPFHRCVAPMVVDHLDRCRPNGVVLDLGCGSGEITRSLSRGGFNMVGLDIDLASVQRARQLSPIDCYLVGDAHRIPLRDGAVDGLVSFSTLQYVDWRQVITESRRVLSANGRAAFVENLAGNPVARGYRRLRRLAWRWPQTPLLRRIAHDAPPRGHIAWDETTEFSMTFASTRITGHHLLTPGLLLWRPFYPVNHAGAPIDDRLFQHVTRLDRLVLRRFPALAKYCWIVVVRANKGRTNAKSR